MNVGIVNWFGGVNKKTGKANDFGFLTTIEPEYGEELYFNQKSVLTEEQHLLESGVYIQFEIIVSNNGRKKANNVKPISHVGIVDWFKNGRGYINSENIPDVRIETSQSLKSGDIVFFFRKRNLVYKKDEAISLKKVEITNEDETIIEKCANSQVSTIYKLFIVDYALKLPECETVEFILSKLKKLDNLSKYTIKYPILKSLIAKSENLFCLSAELRYQLAITDSLIYCDFINNNLSIVSADLRQELLKELICQIKEESNDEKSKYWNRIDFLKQNIEYEGYLWDIASENVKIELIKKRYQKFANLALALPKKESIAFLINKIKEIDDKYKPQVIDSLFEEAEDLFISSSELCKLLIYSYDISKYCHFINTYIEIVDKNLKHELLNDLSHRIEKGHSSLRSQYWSKIDFLKKNIQYKGDFWDFAPEDLKIKLIKEHYQTFFDLIFQFEKSEYPYSKELTILFKELYQFDDLDWSLIDIWCPKQNGNINEFELARMMSARGAEKLVFSFYKALGYSVEDTAAHQVTQESNTWIKGDIRLNSDLLIDVKNARTTINSDTYSEFCVPAFKQNRGSNVLITAVLSPYLQTRFMKDAGDINFPVTNPVVLGSLNNKTLITLEDVFSDRLLSIDISRNSTSNRYLPPWMFDYDDSFYVEQHKIISKFKALSDSDIPDWEDIRITKAKVFPLFIAAKIRIPKKWQSHVPVWKSDFINNFINVPVENISLPYLFLGLLKHFLKNLSKEDKTYSPRDYKDLIYANSSEIHPLKIYDHLNIIRNFCDTLQILWENREIANLDQFTMFKFNGQGLLQGKKEHSDKFLTTILAYCGGWVEKKGKCGHRPLIVGRHNNCSACGRLICPKDDCQFCSANCENYVQRQHTRLLTDNFDYFDNF
ncbi:hypothetical protein [Pleurocapsa sp. PCC 7319]|uniref:hypothetical protein n=1 Tax=Pleurocapsa sp. PCC 7319 TaxID=118161 RepID=UPI00034B769C|nr:hypothetical protein [Pleurocapsa sp. PCC 7319]